MSELRPCGACRRHVSIHESACPFCGITRSASEPGGMRFRRVSRAAVFAGAAIASAGCGGKKKPDTLDNNTQQTAQSDAGVVQEPPPPPYDPNQQPMPYGAPPARRRVV